MKPKLSCERRHTRALHGWLRTAVTAALMAQVAITASADPPAPRPTRLPPVASAATRTASAVTRRPRFETIEPTIMKQASAVISPQPERPQPWLGSSSSTAALRVAAALLVEAQHEYDVKAFASAENTAWKALHHAARAIDLTQREGTSDSPPIDAAERLVRARTAIREARDFVSNYGTLDEAAIARIARSHQSELISDQQAASLTAADASDRYLDEARTQLSAIARESLEAAQAMDLLAAIHLSRAAPSRLPSATALCLRRAALQGQPRNASLASRLGMHLADVGLLQEAEWALQHSLTIRQDPQVTEKLVEVLRRSGQTLEAQQMIAQVQQRKAASSIEARRPRMPAITQLSPEEFAAVSRPVMTPKPHVSPALAAQAPATNIIEPVTRVATVPPAQIAPQPGGTRQPGGAVEQADSGNNGAIRRFFGSLRSVW